MLWMRKKESSGDTGSRLPVLKRSTKVTEGSDDAKGSPTLQKNPAKKSRLDHGEESKEASSSSKPAVSREVTTFQQPNDSSTPTPAEDTGIYELNVTSPKYEAPTSTLSKEDLLPVADQRFISAQWHDEYEEMTSDFSTFTARKYVLNKSYVVERLLLDFDKKKQKVCAICMPTGCLKTSNSIVLEKFFSANIDDEQKMLPWFQEKICDKLREKYMFQYSVFRISFSTLVLSRVSTIRQISNYIYSKFVTHVMDIKNGEFLKLLNESVEFKNYDRDVDNVDIFRRITEWLEKTFNLPVVIILDELDLPLSSLVIRNQYTGTVADYFKAVVSELVSTPGHPEFVIGLGIHPWYDVFSPKFWYFKLVDDHEWANCFLFTQVDMDELRTRYELSDEDMAKIKASYGGYTFNLYNPSSVTRYLYNNKELKLYKWHRRTADILDLNRHGVKLYLTGFLSGEELKLTVSLASNLQNAYNYEAALAHYVSAGLLSLRIVPKKSSKDHQSPEEMYISAGNLENRNIIGFFLKCIVDVSDVSEVAIKVHSCLINERFEELAELVNDAFRNKIAKELVKERDYHNALHFFFYLLIRQWWEVKSEDCFRTGHERTGKSGHCDLTLKLINKPPDQPHFVIMELKVASAPQTRKNQDVTRDDITKTKEIAFQQILTKGYAGDQTGKISSVAVVCHGKIVEMFLMKPSDEAALLKND